MHRGRVRAVSGDGRVRFAIARARVAVAPAGKIDHPRGLGSLRWHECALPATAAGTMREAGLWDWDTKRDFDGEDWWWRISLDGAERGDVIDFEGVATMWDAWLDGEWVAHGENMFVPRAIELEQPGKELVIRCRSLSAELAKKRPRPRWRVPMLEHQQLRWVRTTLLGRTPGWSPACPPVGPWRPIVFQRGGLRVGTVTVDTSVDSGTGFLRVGAILDPKVESASLVVDGVPHAMTHEMGAWTAQLAIPNVRLWWPHTHGEPALYRLAIEATPGPVTIDLGASGFRTVSFDDANLVVNGVPVFARGACWTPLDPVTLRAPREAYAAAVAQMRACGMNMLRVGGTMIYEDDALYDALDEHGVLLWHDLMFANMDYPDDADFVRNVELEADAQLSRLRARPSLAVVCGNSEGGQQAAMAGAPRDKWTPALFHEVLPAAVALAVPGIPYVPSSTHGGAFPHEPQNGVASYYGVGAYMRPLEDARRSEVRFASECLAFANIGADASTARVHDPRWKAGSPRDLGAGWDFDDIRDFYVKLLFGVDPLALRTMDHERYLALGRVATGEAMARTFGEWRRLRSVTRGGLLWFLRDLRPGAGWGVIDSTGAPKPAWYALRRALAPVAIAITDEGTNGLALHVVNDRPEPLRAGIVLDLWRGSARVGEPTAIVSIEVQPHRATEFAIARLFEGWMDLSFAYRFGPPAADMVHARLDVGGATLADTFWFPAGLLSNREADVGLSVAVDGDSLAMTSQRFAQFVAIEGKNLIASDNYFHLAPGQTRRIHVGRGVRGTVTALNSERTVRFEVP
jgi:beta-mannosidase